MTPWWVLALIAFGAAFIGGVGAYFVGLANDRRRERAQRLTDVRRLVAELSTHAQMISDFMLTQKDSLESLGQWPPTGPLDSPRLDTFVANLRTAATQLRLTAARSRLLNSIDAVERAAYAVIRARNDSEESLSARDTEVQRAIGTLTGVVHYMNMRGDRYFDRDLQTFTPLNPIPIAIAGSREPPGYMKAWYVRRKTRFQVRRIQARQRRTSHDV